VTRLRSRVPTSVEQVRAVMRHWLIYELGTLIPADPPTGRRPAHPGYLLIAFGVLARMIRSRAELRTGALWPLMRAEALAMRDQLPEQLWAPPGDRPPTWAAWQYARNTHLTTDEGLRDLHALFVAGAVAQARGLDLPTAAAACAWPHPYAQRWVQTMQETTPKRSGGAPRPVGRLRPFLTLVRPARGGHRCACGPAHRRVDAAPQPGGIGGASSGATTAPIRRNRWSAALA
jgi:hypothetical protein